MFRIDLKTGEMITPSGKKSQQKIHFIEAQQQTVQIALFNGQEPYTIPENAVVTIAGDVSEDNPLPMFVAEGTIAEDRQSVFFDVNTYTEEYCQRVHASNSRCLVDIYIKLADAEFSRRLVRFTALADARVYIEGQPPTPLNQYYTSEQVDQLLKNAAGAKSFNSPTVSTTTLPAGQDAQAAVTLKTNEDTIDLGFEFAIPRGLDGTNGIDAYTVHPVEYIYFDSTYGTVCYLDADNGIVTLCYQAEPWHAIKLYLCSSDQSASGNIVLTCGNNTLVTNVQAAPQLVIWQLDEPVSGKISIMRAVDDLADTLKDASGNVITVLAIDWRSR